jgi:hypothetical protein
MKNPACSFYGMQRTEQWRAVRSPGVFNLCPLRIWLVWKEISDGGVLERRSNRVRLSSPSRISNLDPALLTNR